MRNSRIQRLVVAGVGVGALTLSVIAGPLGSSASVVKPHTAALSTLDVPWSPGSVPTSVFPFYTAAQCTTTNINYWNLMYRPGYWFGLGSSIAEQPALSPLNTPTFGTSGSDTTATVTSKGWNWTNSNSSSASSETLDAQDIVFWLNMDKAQSQQGSNASCGYVPSFGIPDQVKNVTEDNGPTGMSVTITFTGAESHAWLLANELSQIDPMPIAWDTTNGTNKGGCSTETWSQVSTSGSDQCSQVFTYLSGLQINDPIWNWADGPYRQQTAGYASGSPDGNDVQIANSNYSGPVKAHAVQTIVYKPYATVAAEIADLQSGKLTSGYVDPTNVTKSPGPGKAGTNLLPHLSNFTTVGSLNWGVFYWMFNFGNEYSTWPSTAAWTDLVNQQYIRGAMQQSENQAQIDSSVNNGYSVPTISAIPTYPANSYATGVTNPYPFSTSTAKATLTLHGWNTKVFPAVCNVTNCGTTEYPIAKGAKLSLTVLVPSGDPAVTQQVSDEIATAKEAGIQIIADYQKATDVQADCFGGAAEWQLCAYGGWIYAPDYYPSGEVLFATGSGSNSGGYSSPEMQTLVADTTISGNYLLNQKNPAYGTSFAQFSAQDVPFLWQPTPAGFGEVLKSIKGAQAPNPLGDFNPEYITAI